MNKNNSTIEELYELSKSQVLIRRYSSFDSKKKRKKISVNQYGVFFPGDKVVKNDEVYVYKDRIGNEKIKWNSFYLFNTTCHELIAILQGYYITIKFQFNTDYGIKKLANCFNVKANINEDFSEETIIAKDFIQYFWYKYDFDVNDFNSNEKKEINKYKLKESLEIYGIEFKDIFIGKKVSKCDRHISPSMNSPHMILEFYDDEFIKELSLNKDKKVVFGYAPTKYNLSEYYKKLGNLSYDITYINIPSEKMLLLGEVSLNNSNSFELKFCRNESILEKPIYIKKLARKKIERFISSNGNLFHGDKILIGDKENPDATIYIFERL